MNGSVSWIAHSFGWQPAAPWLGHLGMRPHLGLIEAFVQWHPLLAIQPLRSGVALALERPQVLSPSRVTCTTQACTRHSEKGLHADAVARACTV